MKMLLLALVIAWPFVLSHFVDSTWAQEIPVQLDNVRTVPWNQVPFAVQRVFRSHAGTESISEVEEGNVDDRVVYRASWQENGRPIRLLLTEDGSLFSARRWLALNEVPTAVQESLRSINNLAALESISVESAGGQTVYEFGLNNAGSLSRLRIAEDGKIVGLSNITPISDPNTLIAWNRLPTPVQQTILGQASSSQVELITQTTEQERPVYDITFTESGQTMQMRVANDGTVVSGGVSIIESAGADRKSIINFSDLPVSTQNTIKDLTGADPILSIRRDVTNGRTYYEVSFEQNGQPMTICVGEDGVIVR